MREETQRCGTERSWFWKVLKGPAGLGQSVCGGVSAVGGQAAKGPCRGRSVCPHRRGLRTHPPASREGEGPKGGRRGGKEAPGEEREEKLRGTERSEPQRRPCPGRGHRCQASLRRTAETLSCHRVTGRQVWLAEPRPQSRPLLNRQVPWAYVTLWSKGL